VTGCSGTDQRGVSRPQGSACDIGAYEMIITTGDSQAPSTPANLRAPTVTANSVMLAWDPSSDNVGVTGYTVYRDGNEVGATGGADATTFTDSSVAPSMAYSYTVDAFDGSGNHSQPSSPPLSVNTPSS
jgi:fibronectin type 3 domain-containing protein